MVVVVVNGLGGGSRGQEADGQNCSSAQSQTMSKRRKFVADGVFYAELNEFFTRELAEEGYSGVEVRVTPTVTDISTSSPPGVRGGKGGGGGGG